MDENKRALTFAELVAAPAKHLAELVADRESLARDIRDDKRTETNGIGGGFIHCDDPQHGGDCTCTDNSDHNHKTMQLCDRIQQIRTELPAASEELAEMDAEIAAMSAEQDEVAAVPPPQQGAASGVDNLPASGAASPIDDVVKYIEWKMQDEEEGLILEYYQGRRAAFNCVLRWIEAGRE